MTSKDDLDSYSEGQAESAFPDKKDYKTVIIDPPWSYDQFGAKKHGAVRAHYSSLSYEQLQQLPINDWIDETCFLIMWGTWPKLNEAIDLGRHWGFTYLTGIPWIKTTPNTGNIRTGIGFYFQSVSELILIFKKGKGKSGVGEIKKERKRFKGLLCGSEKQFYAPTKGHSEKPLTINDWARETFKGPYLELFARS